MTKKSYFPVGYIHSTTWLGGGPYEIEADRGERIICDGRELEIDKYPLLDQVLREAGFEQVVPNHGMFRVPDCRGWTEVAGMDLLVRGSPAPEPEPDPMPVYRHLVGDCRELLPTLEASSVQCVVTSPPYWGQNDYTGSDAEIGLNCSLDQYVWDLTDIGREIFRVLAADGIWWLNIGDTFSNSGGAGGDYNSGGSRDGQRKWKQGVSGLLYSQQCLVPFRVAQSLQHSGWILRKVIVWDQGKVRPESISHVRRPLIGHEYIFMFVQSMGYRFYPPTDWPEGVVSDIWRFPPERSKRGSRAFPRELPRRCIEMSTTTGDWVLDPFGGTGTTADVANSMGRNAIDIELQQSEES